MNRLLEWSRWVWLEVQLAAPPVVQRTVIPCLREAKETARLLLRPYLTVYQWQGRGQGGALLVNYAGSGDAKLFLKRVLFVEEPAESEVGQVPLWRVRELADLSTGDITIVEADRRLIHQLPDQCALMLPNFVEMVLDVRGDWQDVESRFRKSARRERRLTRKYGYSYEVSRSDQDFEMFYRDMYLPTTKVRHGAYAVPMSESEACQHFRHGLLFFVRRDGRRVSGGLFHLGRDMVRFILVGVFNGDEQLMKEGAVGALNYLRIQWANQNGYKAVDLGYCRPFVRSLFHYKRKWGTAARAPSDLKQRIWIRLRRNTPAVYQFMKDNPCIVIDEEYQPYVVVITDTPATAKAENEVKWRKQFETPGLKGLLIRSMADFFEKPATRITEVDPATSIMF
jgi:hypothetical protein